MSTASRLITIYHILLEHFGPQNWWPAESPFEMMVGAVLTQNTSWSNVTRAIGNLRNAGLLSFEHLYDLPDHQLAEQIRPSGYYNLKARRLKNLIVMLAEQYAGSLESLLQDTTANAREQLLTVQGIGPETADSILLYGGNHPVFVVDAYTHRIFSRHHLIEEECDYQALQDLFMDNLPPDPAMFNEYHALIVRAAKTYCRKTKPLCSNCPLQEV